MEIGISQSTKIGISSYSTVRVSIAETELDVSVVLFILVLLLRPFLVPEAVTLGHMITGIIYIDGLLRSTYSILPYSVLLLCMMYHI